MLPTVSISLQPPPIPWYPTYPTIEALCEQINREMFPAQDRRVLFHRLREILTAWGHGYCADHPGVRLVFWADRYLDDSKLPRPFRAVNLHLTVSEHEIDPLSAWPHSGYEGDGEVSFIGKLASFFD